MDRNPGAPLPNPTNPDETGQMTDHERQLQRTVEQLQTQVFMLGTIVGIVLSLVGKVGWRQVEEAIYLGLADAAASIPPESEADWDRFMAFIRSQGTAVKVERVPQPTQRDPADSQRR